MRMDVPQTQLSCPGTQGNSWTWRWTLQTGKEYNKNYKLKFIKHGKIYTSVEKFTQTCTYKNTIDLKWSSKYIICLLWDFLIIEARRTFFSEYVYLYVNLYKISEEIFFATLISGNLAGYPVIWPDNRIFAGYPALAGYPAGYRISGIWNQPDIRYSAKKVSGPTLQPTLWLRPLPGSPNCAC